MLSKINISKFNNSNSLLVLILLIGSILRCWNLFDIPYTHDEMSALLRTRFDTFGQLIELGVKTDTHPAGVQVFMYYWVSLFGEQSWIVKLPFISMGIGAIYYSYKLAINWFNESAALFSSAFLAVLQFPVIYSQIARPYVSGLFLIMAFTYYLNQLIEKNYLNKKSLIYSIIFGTLCAYNHHFSLLLSVLIGLCFIIISPNRKLLIGVAGGIGILYLPHIEIFIHQLQRGGVGDWLGAPSWEFGWQFLKYSFHYSYVVLALIILILAFPFLLEKKRSKSSKKWTLVSFLISIVYFSIGFLYSLFVNPIIQYSMVLYIYPFILFFIFSSIPKLSRHYNFIIVTSILVVGSLSLVFERNHYFSFYHTRYFQMLDDMNETFDVDSDFILTNIPEFVNFYQNKTSTPLSKNFGLFDKDTSGILHFHKLLNNCNKEHLMLGLLEQTPKEILTLSLEKYPFVTRKREYHGAATYWLSRTGKASQTLNYSRHLPINFKTKNALTSTVNQIDSLWNKSTQLYTSIGEEYSLGMELNLKDSVKHKYDIIATNAIIEIENPNTEVLLVNEFFSDGESISWQASSSLNSIMNKGGEYHISTAIDRNTINLSMEKDLTLKTYIWIPSKNKVSIKEISLKIIEGNRNKYCLFDPIYRP